MQIMTNSLDYAINTLGCQLHDLPRQVNHPNHLLLLPQHLLAQLQHPLVYVPDQLLILNHLPQLVWLYISNPVNDDSLLFGVPSHDCMHVDFLQISDLLVR